MISYEQLKQLSVKYKINESIVAREFIQVTFLKELYEQNFSKKVFFKGGTAIRLAYGGKRFSEDLDFTVTLDNHVFTNKIGSFFAELSSKYGYTFKERKTLSGKTFVLTAKIPNLASDAYVKLDFSMRETAIEPVQVILKSEYPIIVQSFINCLSKKELFAEKIRAITKRKKNRDLYDLWILYELGASFDVALINSKLTFYKETFNKSILLESLKKFRKDEFVKNLRPFVPIDERNGLGDLFEYIRAYLTESFNKL